MRKKIYSVVKELDKKVRKTVRRLLIPEKEKTVHELNVEKWYRDEGHETRRFDYPLTKDSVVFDLGGYEGQWASDIYSKYNCKILVFEPYLPFAKNIEKRFSANDNIKIFQFGLGAKNTTVGFISMGDSSSILRDGAGAETIEIVSMMDFLNDNNIKSVDLMKINIEGAEYELLEFILANNLAGIFKNIQVQFHDFVDNAKDRMSKIQEGLSKTHSLTYQYEFVWENWKLKE